MSKPREYNALLFSGPARNGWANLVSILTLFCLIASAGSLDGSNAAADQLTRDTNTQAMSLLTGKVRSIVLAALESTGDEPRTVVACAGFAKPDLVGTQSPFGWMHLENMENFIGVDRSELQISQSVKLLIVPLQECEPGKIGASYDGGPAYVMIVAGQEHIDPKLFRGHGLQKICCLGYLHDPFLNFDQFIAFDQKDDGLRPVTVFHSLQ